MFTMDQVHTIRDLYFNQGLPDEITREHYDIKSIKLVRFIYKQCDWQKKLTYRIPGVKYAPDSGLVFFDLRKAYEIHEGRMKPST